MSQIQFSILEIFCLFKISERTTRVGYNVHANLERLHLQYVLILFSVSSISSKNTHQISDRSVHYFVFGIRLNRVSRVISKKWKKENFVLIKHYLMKGKSPQETKQNLDKRYGKSASSIRTIYEWFQNFWNGHMSTSDAERSESPIEATNPEIIDKVMIQKFETSQTQTCDELCDEILGRKFSYVTEIYPQIR